MLFPSGVHNITSKKNVWCYERWSNLKKVLSLDIFFNNLVVCIFCLHWHVYPIINDCILCFSFFSLVFMCALCFNVVKLCTTFFYFDFSFHRNVTILIILSIKCLFFDTSKHMFFYFKGIYKNAHGKAHLLLCHGVMLCTFTPFHNKICVLSFSHVRYFWKEKVFFSHLFLLFVLCRIPELKH